MPQALYAHTPPDMDARPDRQWHLLDDHLRGVARLAREMAKAFDADDWGECAGLLHDLGKALHEFQDYLQLCAQGKGQRGSVKHSIHGALWALERDSAMGRLLAYIIAGHHGGLPNWDDLERRVKEAKEQEHTDFFSELPALPGKFPFRDTSGNSAGFIISFFVRMVFSCLVDADWLDTEAYMDPKRSSWREGYVSLHELSKCFFPRLEALCSEARESPVNAIRKQVLDDCLTASQLPPGLFSLTVPTGGGKTLSSLAFALRHAEKHGLRRVVYVIPYMSIIEQNADVFREFLGDDAVVEHHSSFDPGDDKEEERPEIRRARLASENWDAPLIATTAVQFFESLFAAKPSRCRKLHNLSRSVVILDEAQMLPRMLLLPCLAAIRELAARYGSTVVLCTATQPAVHKRDDFSMGLENVREIMRAPDVLHQSLRRVRVELLGELADATLADRLAGHGQALCIVNTRGHARKLFELLRGMNAQGIHHLSANMTPHHRAQKIAFIKDALKNKRPCVVVSTQLVEAGVDVDFPVVYRALSGIDSIAQAAGRCDREGLLTLAAGAPGGVVYVFTPEEGIPDGDFRITADKALEIFRLGYEDVLAPEAVEHYFRLLFWQAGTELDAREILQDLEQGAKGGNFPFRTVAEKFRLIDDYTFPVIVPPDEEIRKLARELQFTPAPGRVLRKLQRHMVRVRPRVWRELVPCGAASLVLEGVGLLENKRLYDPDLGLCPEDPEILDTDDTIQ